MKWYLGVNEDVITEYGESKLNDYLASPEVVVETWRRARPRIAEAFGIDLLTQPGATSHAFLESEALGQSIYWPEDSWPAPADTILKEPEDIDKLELVTDFMSRPNTKILRDMRSYMQGIFGPNAGGLHEGMVGNAHITTARNLRGDDIFSDMYDRPEWCHRLFEFLTENHILCTQDCWRYQGIEQPSFFHIADDFAGMVSPPLFKEFVIPYWKRTLEVLGNGCETVMVHSEVMHPEHLQYLHELPCTVVDYGQDPFVTPRQAIDLGIDVSWHYLDLELLIGTPDTIRKRYEYYVESGLKTISLSVVHRRVPPENVRALIAVAKEYE